MPLHLQPPKGSTNLANPFQLLILSGHGTFTATIIMGHGSRMHVYTIVTFAIFYLIQPRRSTIAASALRTPMSALRPEQLHVREKQSRGKLQLPLHTIDSTAFRPTARPLIHMMVKNTNFTKMHRLQRRYAHRHRRH